MVKRSAFTLIELVFAIVIIAITVMTLPVINQVLTKNINTNLIQEAIFAAATELNEVTTVHWDDNSVDTNNNLANVINNLNGITTCESNSSSPRYRLRSGHIFGPYHRKCLNDLTTTWAQNNVNPDVDAVEDINHSSETLFTISTPSRAGYKNDYNSTISIIYSPNFNGTRINMKQIIAKILNTDGDTIISLTTYVANIGEVDYYKRTF